MTGLLHRLGSAFVAPDADRAERSSVAAVAPSIAILCRPADAAAIGGAAALELARASRASHAVVCLWGAAAAARVPASPAARRAASLLRERGYAAVATGRVVRVRLADGPEEAAAEATRAAAACAKTPIALVLAGPREASVDALLARHDRVLVASAGPDVATADLAATMLAASVPTRTIAVPPAPAARLAAATGVAASRAMREALAPALEGLA
jgi:hypothetical protein